MLRAIKHAHKETRLLLAIKYKNKIKDSSPDVTNTKGAYYVGKDF